MRQMQNSGPRQRKQSVAQLERNAALQRVSRTRRFVIGGTAALSAGIAALVSAIAPGHSLGAKTAVASGTGDSASASASAGPSTARASAARAKMPPLAKPSDLGLTGPPSGPTPSDQGNQAPAGNSGPAPSGNSGNTGNTGVSGNSGNTGNTGPAPAGNSGPVAAAPGPPVTSGGS